MAYAVKYFFTFDSQNGRTVRINVSQDGYTGSAIQRHLGQAPVLRKEMNGRICGTSLTFYAECAEDGEFAEFYTSDPKEYKVDLVLNSATVWTGFISPELYNEPDIAPPYDVEVVATDGLGELKLYEFEKQGAKTLLAHLTQIISKAGHNEGLLITNGLRATGVSAGSLLSGVTVNLDYMEGESYYDVLTHILETLHATMTYIKGAWYISRDTDITVSSGKVNAYSTAGASSPISGSVQSVGKMGVADLWPIGNLDTGVEQAKKSVVVTAPWHIFTPLVNPDMESDTGWTKVGATYSSSLKAYVLDGSAARVANITQVLSGAWMGKPLALSVRACANAYSDTDSYVARIYAMHQVGSGTPYQLAVGDEGLVWKTGSLTSDEWPTMTIGAVDSPSDGSIELPPLYINGQPATGGLTVGVYRPNTVIYSVHLDIAAGEGWQDILKIDNGARGEGPETEIGFGRVTSALDSIKGFYQGIALHNGSLITSWTDHHFSNLDFLALTSRGYALDVALPRLRLTGRVDTPAALAYPPLMLVRRGIQYWLETWSWDLFNDELEVSALSLPAVSLTVEEETVTEIETASASGSTGGSTGGGLRSVGLEMPEGFDVENSPLTGNGTIEVSFASGYGLPTTTQMTGWTNKYSKPSTGIPVSDLASGVQTSLGKADTALQAVYKLTIKKNGTKVGNTFDPASADQTIDITDVASASALSTLTTTVSGLSTSKLDKSVFDDLFEKETVDGATFIKAKYNFYSVGAVSAGGRGTGGGGGTGGIDTIYLGSVAYPAGGHTYISLPAYPSVAGLASESWVSEGYQPKITSTNKLAYSLISGTPTSLPASDVYSWAKASTKPSYTTSEVSEGTNLYFTNARAVSALSSTLEGYQPKDADLTAIAALSGTSGLLKKTAANTWSLDTNSYSLSSHTHTFTDLTSHPTTLSGYGITDAKIANGVITLGSNTITPLTSHQSIKTINSVALTGSGNITLATLGVQPADADLTAIAGLTGTSGLLKKTAANTWSLDTNTYLTSHQSIKTLHSKSLVGTGNVTLSYTDVGALGATQTAADSSKLNGQSASYYATAASLSGYARFLNMNNRNLNTLVDTGFHVGYNSGSYDPSGDFGIINIPTFNRNTSTTFYETQIRAYVNSSNLSVRYVNNSGADSWRTIYHSGNCNNTSTAWSASVLSVNKVRILGTMSSSNVGYGVYYYNGTTDYCLIAQGSANLWIGASETVGTHHPGSTYISAGNGSIYASKLVSGTRSNYVMYDASNANNTSTAWSASSLTLNGAISGATTITATTTGTFGKIELGYTNEINSLVSSGNLHIGYRGTAGVISIGNNGSSVGIGTTLPSQKLHVVGNIIATGAITAGAASDSRLKNDVTTLVNASTVLRAIRGVAFKWNSIATENCSWLDGEDVGCIAQEVERYIPSAVGTLFGDYKRLDYTKITPYLIEGWKDHDDEISRLKRRVAELENRLSQFN